jgi:hypothetical protein
LPGDELYGVSRNLFVVRFEGGEMRLVDRLFNAIRLPSRLKTPSRSHSQKDVSLPLMVSSHLSWMRNTSI